jgi:hypothetical protein
MTSAYEEKIHVLSEVKASFIFVVRSMFCPNHIFKSIWLINTHHSFVPNSFLKS